MAIKQGNLTGYYTTLVVVYYGSKAQSNSAGTAVNSAPKITCTGPDKKTFVTTQQACDDFNRAWNNLGKVQPKATTQTNTGNTSSTNKLNVVPCVSSAGKLYYIEATDCANLQAEEKATNDYLDQQDQELAEQKFVSAFEIYMREQQLQQEAAQQNQQGFNDCLTMAEQSKTQGLVMAGDSEFVKQEVYRQYANLQDKCHSLYGL